jgi:hypothetical protein
VAQDATYYSFIVQVAPCMVLLEFMSATQSSLPSPRYHAPHARLHGSTPRRLPRWLLLP